MSSRRRIVALQSACGMAMIVTAPALAQQAVGPRLQDFPPIAENQARAFEAERGIADEKGAQGDLRVVAESAGVVFEGELLSATARTPAGMRVLVTDYVFRVHEYFRGGTREATVSFTELGGDLPDGSGGMTTGHSHKFKVGGRYLVFLEKGHAQVLMPVMRALQIYDRGMKVTDEAGRVAVGLRDGWLVVRDRAELPDMKYLHGAPPKPELADMGPPPLASEPLPAQPPANADQGNPIAASAIFGLLRAGAPAPMGAEPAGLNSAAMGGADYIYCGYLNQSSNFRALMPDNNHWAWFTNAEADWNTNVSPHASNADWLYGYFLDGNNNPIRNVAPVANNNQHNTAVPSDAILAAGGYPSWAAQGNPNGICYTWYVGGSCTRIRETDVFVNPVNAANEVQFRKSVVHELGHALGLDHEDRYVAIMVSGTWRVPPNYGTNTYTRADDVLGARIMLLAANGITPGTWVLENWRDINTVAQAHPNAGSSGDVGPNVTSLSTYSASTGQTVTISHMHVENRGRVGFSGAVTGTLYLSTNNIISAGDYAVGTFSWPSFGNEAAANNFSLNFTVPGTVPTGTYYIGWILSTGEAELTSGNNTELMVRDSSNSFSQRTIQISNTTPANDACGNAAAITDGTYAGSTASATPDGQTSCGFGSANPDVWYSYTATCAGTLAVDTCGSNYDTVLSIHSACPGTAANALVCNDDDGFCGGSPPRQSYVTLPVSAGVTYKIRVSGYNGATGAYNLHVGLSPDRPANDLIANATPIGDGAFPGSTTCALTDGATTCGSSNSSPDVWYAYTPSCSGQLTVATCGATYDSAISIHTGAPGTAGNTLACDDDGCGYPSSSLTASVTGGATYYIRVSGYSGAYGDFTLTTALAGSTPVNDNCPSATPIGNGSFPYEMCGATTDGPQEPGCSFCCGDPQINRDIWFRYTAPASGSVTASICSASYDSKIGVYGGTCPAAPGTIIVCNDDGCGATGLQSQVSFNAVAGQQYLVRVGAYSAAVGGGTLVVTGPAVSCYANCDGSTIPPILNVLDFNCFLNRFAAGNPYANCDGSTIPPVLNVLDFNCFLNRFAAGCSAP